MCRGARRDKRFQRLDPFGHSSVDPDTPGAVDFRADGAGQVKQADRLRLRTSERTVRAHRLKIMEKLGVHSLTELVSAAERLGAA